jgi:hypothetical protein
MTLPVFCFPSQACLNLLLFATTFVLKPRQALNVHELAGLLRLPFPRPTESFIFFSASFLF